MVQWRSLGYVSIIISLGCGGRPQAQSPGGASGDASTRPQSQLAAGFPSARTDYWCQWAEGTGYNADKTPTLIGVEAAKITLYPASAKFQASEGTAYPLDAADRAYVIPRADPEDDQRSIVLADKLMFMMVEQPGAVPAIEYVCAAQADQGRITGAPPATHLARLAAYADARQQAYDAVPHDDADLAAALALADDALDAEDDAEPAAATWTPEQAAKLARGRTMESFSFVASQANPDANTSLRVTMQLADGSTLTSGLGDPVFYGLFAWSTLPSRNGLFVRVWPRGADGEPVEDLVQTQEITFSHDTERTFTCQGEPGKTGLDQDWNNSGMKYYVGQPGEPGPDITVEITAVGSTTPQVLRYRLTCGDQREVFDASPSSPIHVATYGGVGGHGIPRANGDGTSGGDGGDGGDVTVIVDPSVAAYTLTHTSAGGAGGNASDTSQTNDSTERDTHRGAKGGTGAFAERRARVSIP